MSLAREVTCLPGIGPGHEAGARGLQDRNQPRPSEERVRVLNRSALIVRPREPYVRWATSRDAGSARFAERIASHVSVYLLDENPRGDAETPPLRHYFKAIFERELAAWDRGEDGWPENRDLAMFHEWFEVTGQSMVLDLGRGRIEAEEY
jgi:hypothetical protein